MVTSKVVEKGKRERGRKWWTCGVKKIIKKNIEFFFLKIK
jgi:hypothetical protein